MSVVALTWIPIKKDAEGSAGAKALGDMKEKILATPGLEHTYHAKSADPNEPASIEIFDGKIPSWREHTPRAALSRRSL